MASLEALDAVAVVQVAVDDLLGDGREAIGVGRVVHGADRVGVLVVHGVNVDIQDVLDELKLRGRKWQALGSSSVDRVLALVDEGGDMATHQLGIKRQEVLGLHAHLPHLWVFLGRLCQEGQTGHEASLVALGEGLNGLGIALDLLGVHTGPGLDTDVFNQLGKAVGGLSEVFGVHFLGHVVLLF